MPITPSQPTARQQPSEQLAQQSRGHEQKILMNSYMDKVRTFIELHQGYPRAAKIRGHQGSVSISFVIDAQGRVSRRKLAKQCHSKFLNKSAKALLRKLRFSAPSSLIAMQFPKTITLDVHYQFN